MLVCSANSTLFSVNSYPVYNSEISTPSRGDFYRYSGAAPSTYLCTSSAQCFDGNVCTQDLCVGGNCIYKKLSGCSSISHAIREQYSPYNYQSLYIENSTDSQELFLRQMKAYGTIVRYDPNNYNGEGSDGSYTDTVTWNFLFFGSLINTFQITNYGAIALPPVGTCGFREV